MNTEEIARVVADQRAYFKTHATFDVDARRRALVRLRFVRTRAISPMRSRPIWVSRMTRRICARSARRFPRFAIRLRMWSDGAVPTCARATSPMLLACARRKPCLMASR